MKEIQAHCLYSPSLSSGMTNGLLFTSRTNLSAIPVPTLIILGMPFRISTQSSATQLTQFPSFQNQW